MDPVQGAGWIKFLSGKLERLIFRRHDWNNSDRVQERRRWIYDALFHVFSEITQHARPGAEGLNTLKLAKAESALYAPTLEPFIQECIVHAAALETARGVLDHPERGNPNVDRGLWLEKDHAGIQFFMKASADLQQRFRPLIGSK